MVEPMTEVIMRHEVIVRLHNGYQLRQHVPDIKTGHKIIQQFPDAQIKSWEVRPLPGAPALRGGMKP